MTPVKGPKVVPTVYYLIKIGYTGHLRTLLTHGNEWFRDAPELREHAALIKAQHGDLTRRKPSRRPTVLIHNTSRRPKV